MLISPDDFTKLFNTMITVIVSPKLHRLLMNVGMIVDDLGPRRTYTGRAGDPRSLFFVQNKDIFQDVSVITEIAAQHDRQFLNFP